MSRWDKAWLQATDRIAREISARIAAAYIAEMSGKLSYDEMISVMSTLIATGQRRAVSMNDVLLARELTSQLNLAQALNPTGLEWRETYREQTDRLAKAVDTVFQVDVDYVKAASSSERAALQRQSVSQRLDRLADSETYDASQWSRQQAAIQHSQTVKIIGYTRRLNPGACDLCWTISGHPEGKYVHHLDHRFAAHPTGSCKCSQEFISELRPDQVMVGRRTLTKNV